MSQTDDPPRVLLIGPFPASWPAGRTDDAVIRRAACIDAAGTHIASRWPEVVVADASTPTRRLRAALEPLDVPVLEVVAPGSSGRTEAPFVDVLVEPVTAPRLARRARRERELTMLRRAVSRQQKLDDTTSLMAGLAHELRNPVHALVQGLEALRQRLPVDLDVRTGRVVEVIDQAANRLLHLARDVRPLEAEDAGPWDPAQSIASALVLLEHRTRGVEVRVTTAATPPVTGCPGQLDLVVTNLLDNALRAAGEGGWVEVSVSPVANAVQIDVEDSGSGVPEGLLKEIFEPFVTTHKADGGTGLGLHLCRRVVDGHLGTLEVSSEPGRGARFTMVLPATGLVTEGSS